MLRSRRGQRLGVDEDADDALALLLTHGVPAAHPRPSEVLPEPEQQEDLSTRRALPSAEHGRPGGRRLIPSPQA